MHNLHTKNKSHPTNALTDIIITIHMDIIMDIHIHTDMGTIITITIHNQSSKNNPNQQPQYNPPPLRPFYISYLRIKMK